MENTSRKLCHHSLHVVTLPYINGWRNDRFDEHRQAIESRQDGLEIVDVEHRTHGFSMLFGEGIESDYLRCACTILTGSSTYVRRFSLHMCGSF